MEWLDACKMRSQYNKHGGVRKDYLNGSHDIAREVSEERELDPFYSNEQDYRIDAERCEGYEGILPLLAMIHPFEIDLHERVADAKN